MFWQPPCVILNVCVSALPMCCIMIHLLWVVLKTSDGSGTLRLVFFTGIQFQCPAGVPLDAPRGAFGAPLATHLPLTCHSLATHLPLTCRSLTSCGPPRSQQLRKKAQRSVLVRACLENSFLRPPESAQCAFFTINTICFEGSESPQECDI